MYSVSRYPRLQVNPSTGSRWTRQQPASLKCGEWLVYAERVTWVGKPEKYDMKDFNKYAIKNANLATLATQLGNRSLKQLEAPSLHSSSNIYSGTFTPVPYSHRTKAGGSLGTRLLYSHRTKSWGKSGDEATI